MQRSGLWYVYFLKRGRGGTVLFQSITLDFISLLIYFPAGSIRKLRRVAGVWSSYHRAWGRRIGYVKQKTDRGLYSILVDIRPPDIILFFYLMMEYIKKPPMNAD